MKSQAKAETDVTGCNSYNTFRCTSNGHACRLSSSKFCFGGGIVVSVHIESDGRLVWWERWGGEIHGRIGFELF